MPDNLEEILTDVQSRLGPVKNMERVNGGAVHYVYKLDLADREVFLKVRGVQFALAPKIITKKELIQNEANALKIAKDLMPGYFPELLSSNSKLGYIVLSDVLPGGVTLEELINSRIASEELYILLGQIIAQMHLALNQRGAANDTIISDPKLDLEKLGYLTDRISESDAKAFYNMYSERPKQFIHGDLSPKNILIKGREIRFCDLDGFRVAAVEIDHAWVVAHTIIHSSTIAEAIARLDNYRSGYNTKSAVNFEDPLLVSLSIIALLYRLDNDLLPYRMAIPEDRKKILAQRMKNSLSHTHSVGKIVDNFFLK